MAGYFNNPIHDEFKAELGFDSPIRTRKQCPVPAFMDKHLHRIAIMKDEYINQSNGGGMPGWIVKFICTGCGREFKNKRAFMSEKTVSNLEHQTNETNLTRFQTH